MGRTRDYVEWHRQYDDPDSSLSWRLRVVQGFIDEVLDRVPGPIRVMSTCAGDGRDLLEVLARRPDSQRVTATLLEANPTLAGRARAAVEPLAARVEVRQVDAGYSDAYAGAVPAELVLLAGVFGNMSAEDIERTVNTTPQFCAPGASVIWTLGHGRGDRVALVRQWFREAGFVELARDELDRGDRPTVGLWRLDAAPAPLQPGRHLFTFIN